MKTNPHTHFILILTTFCIIVGCEQAAKANGDCSTDRLESGYCLEPYADLTGAKLRSSDLSGANLTGADFTFADLTMSDLSNAYLTYTNMSAAILSSAVLTNADLTGTDLTGATLIDAKMHGVVLIGVTVNNTMAPDGTFVNSLDDLKAHLNPAGGSL